MRKFAGDVFISQGDWPSINNPVNQRDSTDVKYDEHMKQYVPMIPVKQADAGAVLREYGNALLGPLFGQDVAPFGRTGLFGVDNGRPLGMMESAERSVDSINQRNAATEEAIRQLRGY